MPIRISFSVILFLILCETLKAVFPNVIYSQPTPLFPGGKLAFVFIVASKEVVVYYAQVFSLWSNIHVNPLIRKRGYARTLCRAPVPVVAVSPLALLGCFSS